MSRPKPESPVEAALWTFASIANWGNLHPEDDRRFRNFITLAIATKSGWQASDVEDRLVNYGLPKELAHKLGQRYWDRAKPKNRKETQASSREAWLLNLDKAMLSRNWHPPRPWRSREETYVIKRLVWLWFGCCGPGQTRESIHSLARVLGVSRSYIQKLVRAFERDPSEMQQQDRRHGRAALLAQLEHARRETQRQRERGELRSGCRKRVNASEHRTGIKQAAPFTTGAYEEERQTWIISGWFNLSRRKSQKPSREPWR